MHKQLAIAYAVLFAFANDGTKVDAFTFRKTAIRSWAVRTSVRMAETIPPPTATDPTTGVKFLPGDGTAPSKLQKVEALKVRSHYLKDPLKDELQNDEIFVSPDAVVVLKHHGSYMQDNRDNRKKGVEKEYQFMLRLKSPAGEIPPNVYLKLDELADKYGQGDLRATTRQAWQMHGIMKGSLKSVISSLIEEGSSTIGACGDVSRNVMCSPAPFTSAPYRYARQYSKVMADLFKPQSAALTDIWLGDEKVAALEYWSRDLKEEGFDIQAAMMKDTGTGIITSDPVEPLYGQRYLPRKFKIAITVPGDNSLDIYINDIGLVVITDEQTEELLGFNVMVGGGMGRTHNKETTFARTADHLGFVKKEDVMELCKSIIAAQRDHGNREVRANARMKYLVHTQGIDNFRKLVEGYFGKPIEAWREIQDWKYSDWMGWHEQGDGNLFLGINIEQGRVKDYETGTEVSSVSSVAAAAAQQQAAADAGTPPVVGPSIKTALKRIVQDHGLTMILSPTQSIILKDIAPQLRPTIEAKLKGYGILPIESVDPLVRKSMACPAFPLCGLAIAEAERRMPRWMSDMRGLMNRLKMGDDEIIMRMTGCPNGCARPYMAELALVGDGPDMYQIWVGGSPNLTNVGMVYANKVKWDIMEKTLEPLLVYWRDFRSTPEEPFGTFCARMGVEKLEGFSAGYSSARAI